MHRPPASVVCPRCHTQLNVQVEVRASVVPPLKLRFQSPDEFAHWLRASGFTVQEFERLPVYEWYRDDFEPLLDPLRHRPADVPATQQA